MDERSKILQREGKTNNDRRKQDNALIVPQWEKPPVLQVSGQKAGSKVPSSSSLSSSSSSSSSWLLSTSASSPYLKGTAKRTSVVRNPVFMFPLVSILPLARDDIYRNFMVSTVLMAPHHVDPNTPPASSTQATRHLLVPVSPSCKEETSLQLAIEAFSRAWFAKWHRQPSVAASGMQRYGLALRKMKQEIENGEWRGRDILRT